MLVCAEFRAKFCAYLIFGCLLLAADGDGVTVPPAIVVCPQAPHNHHIILMDYSSQG